MKALDNRRRTCRKEIQISDEELSVIYHIGVHETKLQQNETYFIEL